MKQLEDIWTVCLEHGIQQRKEEFLPFLQMLRDRDCKSILEIGAYSNACTRAYALLGMDVVSVDLIHRGMENIPNVLFVQGDSSHPKIIDYAPLRNRKFDVIMIDGDHTYKGVKKDFENYRKYLNEGGLIAFHDIWDSHECRRQDCFVFELWEELKKEFEYIELGHVKTWGGIGVLLKTKEI